MACPAGTQLSQTANLSNKQRLSVCQSNCVLHDCFFCMSERLTGQCMRCMRWPLQRNAQQLVRACLVQLCMTCHQASCAWLAVKPYSRHPEGHWLMSEMQAPRKVFVGACEAYWSSDYLNIACAYLLYNVESSGSCKATSCSVARMSVWHSA